MALVLGMIVGIGIGARLTPARLRVLGATALIGSGIAMGIESPGG